MIRNFTFTVGLPGCGKSTYIAENFDVTETRLYDHYESPDFILSRLKSKFETYAEKVVLNSDRNFLLVSADVIKEYFLDYDPNQPELVHEDSVNIAKDFIKYIADVRDVTTNVLLDGGGINNHYNTDIIEYVREKCPEAKINCIYFDTPIEVCMERVRKRERKIPTSAFYEKNLKVERCVNRYRGMVDNFKTVNYFTNRHLFLDMDGTIVAYQKGKLDEDGNTDFVNSELFLYAKPVKHVIDFARNNFDVSEIYIITAVANNIVLNEKMKWLDMHFPEFDKSHFLWVGNKNYKDVFLKHFAIREKMEYKDMTLIDDMHETLSKCLKLGMNAVHPSNIESLKNSDVIKIANMTKVSEK